VAGVCWRVGASRRQAGARGRGGVREEGAKAGGGATVIFFAAIIYHVAKRYTRIVHSHEASLLPLRHEFQSFSVAL
jgi:hypothetical protein